MICVSSHTMQIKYNNKISKLLWLYIFTYRKINIINPFKATTFQGIDCVYKFTIYQNHKENK